MRKSAMQGLAIGVLITMLGLVGCKSDDNGGDDTDAGHGGGAGTGSSNDPDELNPDCPTKVGPAEGKYGQKGACCYRSANSTRVDEQGDGDAVVVEYRLNYVQTINHQATIGQDILRGIGQSRSENEEQSILWRFTGPYKDGEQASGQGTIQIGSGRYNCDGTYSYYSNKAAPARTFSKDPARWVSPIVPVTIDATKDKPEERTVPDWDKNANRGYTLTPYLNSADFTLDWELVNQGFTIDDMPTDKSALNCIGERTKSGGWKAGGTFVVYTPLDVNNTDPIAVLNGQTYCQLVAFGVLDPKEIHDPAVSCADVERCKPGAAGCRWLKLPDSLCPVTDGEKKNWGCHLGDKDNVDKEPTNCTMEKPTGSLDPAKGGKTLGQCCDPMGVSKDIPACNAFFLRNEFVAAAADITDDEKTELQQDCSK